MAETTNSPVDDPSTIVAHLTKIMRSPAGMLATIEMINTLVGTLSDLSERRIEPAGWESAMQHVQNCTEYLRQYGGIKWSVPPAQYASASDVLLVSIESMRVAYLENLSRRIGRQPSNGS